MKNNGVKPSPEAKALSLFLMAYKSTSHLHKEKSKRISRLWNLVTHGDISMEEYLEEVHETLESFGGYTEVIWKTVKFYIKKSGKWTLKGDDQYCVDAQKIADQILNK